MAKTRLAFVTLPPGAAHIPQGMSISLEPSPLDTVRELPDTGKPLLRVGVLLNALAAPRWVEKILRDIRSCGFASLVLVVLNEPEVQAPAPWGERLRAYWKEGFFRRYERWDYARNRTEPDAFETVDIRPLVEGADRITVRPTRSRFVDRLGDADVERIRAARLDVLFRFGFRILKGPVLEAARHGVWSFHHGDNREYRGVPPGFWELYEGNPRTGSILQVLDDKLDGGRVLYRSRSATDPRSLYRTRNPLYWKTAEFALRRLRDLHDRGWEYIESLECYREQNAYQRGIYRTPGPSVMARFLVRRGLASLRDHALSLVAHQREEWFVALRPRRDGVGEAEDLGAYREVPCAPDRFYADPFLLKKDGVNHLFVEDYRFAEGKAVISCAAVNDRGLASAPRVVLDRPYHLSYPFVFEWSGGTFMIPETKSNGTIELYRATSFPDEWVLDTVLMQGVRATDATLFEHGGRFWLFTNMSGPAASSHEELFAFLADSPRGPWRPHPCNPVVSDVSDARPAGALFRRDGRIFRPAQDCAVRYGHALVLNEVVVLTETDYREVPSARIGPEGRRDIVGTHTYARSEDLEAIDLCRMRVRLKSPW
jgi:hypothetical protein